MEFSSAIYRGDPCPEFSFSFKSVQPCANLDIRCGFAVFFSFFPWKILTSVPRGAIIMRSKEYRYGLVAQLGAHHIRIVGVVGSNPIRSTKQEKSEPVSDWKRVRIFRFLRVRQRRLP